MLPDGELGDQKVLAALLGISEMVAGLTDLEEVLGAIVRITPQLVGVDRCAILLYDPRKREFRTAQVFGPDRERNATFQRLVIREEDVRVLAHRILEQKLPALVREGSLPPQMAESLGMRTVLQWETSEVEGKGFSQTFTVTDREGVRLPESAQAADLVLRSLRREPPILFFQRKDGSRVLCEVRSAPVRDDLGEVLEIVCAL